MNRVISELAFSVRQSNNVFIKSLLNIHIPILHTFAEKSDVTLNSRRKLKNSATENDRMSKTTLYINVQSHDNIISYCKPTRGLSWQRLW